MKEKSIRSFFKLLTAMAGGFLFALSYRMFLVPLDLYSGGFTGISQMILYCLEHLFNIVPPAGIDLTGIVLWILNIPLLLLCWKIVSRTFMLRTLATVLVQSAAMALIPAPGAPLFVGVPAPPLHVPAGQEGDRHTAG